MLEFTVAIAIGLVVAVAFFPALAIGGLVQRLTWLAASLVIAVCPGIVPLDQNPLRLLAALVAMSLLCKLYDLNASDLPRLSFRHYLGYLVNWLWLVRRRVPPAVDAKKSVARLVGRIAGTVIMAWACVVVFSHDWSAVPLVVEHCVKVVAIIALTVMIVSGTAQTCHLLGIPALDPMNNPAAAKTPADFWRRWNEPAQQFFEEYVFRPAGGFRRPLRAMMLTFVVSGLVHEYMFSFAGGHIQGTQTVFFTLHGLATAATWRIRPRGWAIAVWLIGTFVFNLVIAAIFFYSVNEILPFYTPRSPEY